MLRFILHYGIHFGVPLLIALFFYKSQWKKALFIMLLGLLIDLDHLLANPIFDASRCSINFHPLHSYIAIGFYTLLLIPKATRIMSTGLCIHILADTIDCLFI